MTVSQYQNILNSLSQIIIFMRLSYFIILILAIVHIKTDPTSTKITFYVKHEVEIQKDYIEIQLQVKAEDSSLNAAVDAAAGTVAFLKNIADQYCKTNEKTKGECQQISKSGKFKVDPFYRLIQKVPVFISFSVSYQVVLKVLQTQNVGDLVDKINKKKGTFLKRLEWKSLSEGDQQTAAIGQGVEQAHKKCKNLGLLFQKIDSIQQITQFQTEEVEINQQQQNQQSDTDKTEFLTYKFVVQCAGKQSAKKK